MDPITLGALGTGALYDATGSIEQTPWTACCAVVAGGLAWRVDDPAAVQAPAMGRVDARLRSAVHADTREVVRRRRRRACGRPRRAAH